MADENINLSPMALKKRHRKQVQLQIWLPVWASGIIVLALAGYAIFGTIQQSSEVNRWGNISAVLMILPNLLTSLVSIVILVFIIRGVAALYRKVPGWLGSLHAVIVKVKRLVRIAADKLAAPIISADSATTGLRSIGKRSTPR